MGAQTGQAYHFLVVCDAADAEISLSIAAGIMLERDVEGQCRCPWRKAVPGFDTTQVGQGQAGDGLIPQFKRRAEFGRRGQFLQALEMLTDLTAPAMGPCLGQMSSGASQVLRALRPGLVLQRDVPLVAQQRRHEKADDQRKDQRCHEAPQDRLGGMAPAPAPGTLQRNDAPRLDRLIGQKAAQVLSQLCRGCIALAGVLGHGLEDDGFQIAGDVRIELARPRRLFVRHLFDQPRPMGFGEGRPPGQQLVKRNAKTVDIAARIGLALEALRGHVAQCADDVAGLGQFVAVLRLGQTEIGQPHRAARVQQQVGRLDVAVQNPLPVRVGQGLGHLHGHLRRTPEVLRVRLFRPGHYRSGKRRTADIGRR